MSERTHYNVDCNVIIDLKDGSETSLRKIYIAYYQQLLQYGCSVEPDEELVHDEIQDLFVWLIKNTDKLAHIDNIKTYLFKSLRRNIRSSSKKKKEMKSRAFHYTNLERDTGYQYDWGDDHDLRSEQITELRKQIENLSSHQKEAIYLRFYENLSNDEIAEVFSVSNQVVRNILFRALKNLRKHSRLLKSITVIPMALFLLFSA